MTVEIALLISALSVGFAVYSGIQNLKRNDNGDCQVGEHQQGHRGNQE